LDLRIAALLRVENVSLAGRRVVVPRGPRLGQLRGLAQGDCHGLHHTLSLVEVVRRALLPDVEDYRRTDAPAVVGGLLRGRGRRAIMLVVGLLGRGVGVGLVRGGEQVVSVGRGGLSAARWLVGAEGSQEFSFLKGVVLHLITINN
jgi:hypothetical protein